MWPSRHSTRTLDFKWPYSLVYMMYVLTLETKKNKESIQQIGIRYEDVFFFRGLCLILTFQTVNFVHVLRFGFTHIFVIHRTPIFTANRHIVSAVPDSEGL